MDATVEEDTAALRSTHGAGAHDQAMLRCLIAARRGDRAAIARWRAVLERLALTITAWSDG